jgi:hypothetical protein
MTNLGSIDASAIKHIWLVGTNRRRVQQMVAKQPSLPAANAKRLRKGAQRPGNPVAGSRDMISGC